MIYGVDVLSDRRHGFRIQFDYPYPHTRTFTVLQNNMRPTGPLAVPGDHVQIQLYTPDTTPRTAGIRVEDTGTTMAAMLRDE